MRRSLSLLSFLVLAAGCRSGRPMHPTVVTSEGSRVDLGERSDVLYVIDGRVITRSDSTGVPAAVRTLDPNRIRSVEVLKGARAKLAYGDAGASGVVVITTTGGR